MFEFHISRFSRSKYDFSKAIFQFTGNAILADFVAARSFAAKINAKRDLASYPHQAAKAGEINAMGLIDEILHAAIAEYQKTIAPNIMEEALAALETQLGPEAVDRALRLFVDRFPPVRVYQGEVDAETYFQGETEGRSHRAITLEELLMLWLSNANPAFSKYGELFDDDDLESQTEYRRMITGLETFFAGQPSFGPQNLSLFDLLRQPALKHPDSLFAQLEYLQKILGTLLPGLMLRLLRSLDLIREENKLPFTGPGETQVISFGTGAGMGEVENYSPDSDWMPSLVLIAKNIFVWLDQLSKRYHRPITTLDQIPDEELDQLARWGFNGLWMIGLWERSAASRTIKHLGGNPDAVASAYSLFDYTIAGQLGGDAAYENLRERAKQRGIRLAADMVPNHTGIYSKWVLEHPEWFIYLDYPPYGAYSFNGTDLSHDPAIGIYL